MTPLFPGSPPVGLDFIQENLDDPAEPIEVSFGSQLDDHGGIELLVVVPQDAADSGDVLPRHIREPAFPFRLQTASRL